VLLQDAQDMRDAGPHAAPFAVQRDSLAPRAQWRPSSLQRLRAGIATARWLDGLGLFAAAAPDDAQVELPAGSSRPPLPPAAAEMLRTSFCTFSENGTLDVAAAGHALRYAGLHEIHDNMLPKEDSLVLSEDDFFRLASEAAMMEFTKSQESALLRLFAQQASSDNPRATIRRAKLAEFFDSNIGQGQVLEVLMGVANVWIGEECPGIDADTFVAIMSRISRVHTKYWHLYNGFTELVKAHGFPVSQGVHKISVDMLMAASEASERIRPLDRETAEEMLRIAGFTRAPDEEDSDLPVDVFEVAAFASRLLRPNAKELPPKPRDAKEIPAQAVQKLLSKHSKSFLSRLEPHIVEEQCVVDNRGGSKIVESGGLSEASTALGMYQGPAVMKTFSAKLDNFFENPGSSMGATIFSLVMALLIMISVLALVIEPLVSPGPHMPRSEQVVWLALDGVFTVIFTIELILRVGVAFVKGQKAQYNFLRAPLNVADFVSVLPWYFDVATFGSGKSEEWRLLRVARLMRLARFVRLGRLAKRCAIIAPISVILIVIWGIFLKNGLSSTC
jgi:hypothetical protein